VLNIQNKNNFIFKNYSSLGDSQVLCKINKFQRGDITWVKGEDKIAFWLKRLLPFDLVNNVTSFLSDNYLNSCFFEIVKKYGYKPDVYNQLRYCKQIKVERFLKAILSSPCYSTLIRYESKPIMNIDRGVKNDKKFSYNHVIDIKKDGTLNFTKYNRSVILDMDSLVFLDKIPNIMVHSMEIQEPKEKNLAKHLFSISKNKNVIGLSTFHKGLLDFFNLNESFLFRARTKYQFAKNNNSAFNAFKTLLHHTYVQKGIPAEVIRPNKNRNYSRLKGELNLFLSKTKILFEKLNSADKKNITQMRMIKDNEKEMYKNLFSFGIQKHQTEGKVKVKFAELYIEDEPVYSKIVNPNFIKEAIAKNPEKARRIESIIKHEVNKVQDIHSVILRRSDLFSGLSNNPILVTQRFVQMRRYTPEEWITVKNNARFDKHELFFYLKNKKLHSYHDPSDLPETEIIVKDGKVNNILTYKKRLGFQDKTQRKNYKNNFKARADFFAKTEDSNYEFEKKLFSIKLMDFFKFRFNRNYNFDDMFLKGKGYKFHVGASKNTRTRLHKAVFGDDFKYCEPYKCDNYQEYKAKKHNYFLQKEELIRKYNKEERDHEEYVERLIAEKKEIVKKRSEEEIMFRKKEFEELLRLDKIRQEERTRRENEEYNMQYESYEMGKEDDRSKYLNKIWNKEIENEKIRLKMVAEEIVRNKKRDEFIEKNMIITKRLAAQDFTEKQLLIKSKIKFLRKYQVDNYSKLTKDQLFAFSKISLMREIKTMTDEECDILLKI
jgi:hypothetical protein